MCYSNLYSYNQIWYLAPKKRYSTNVCCNQMNKIWQRAQLTVFFQYQVLTKSGQLVGQTKQKSFCKGPKAFKWRKKLCFYITELGRRTRGYPIAIYLWESWMASVREPIKRRHQTWYRTLLQNGSLWVENSMIVGWKLKSIPNSAPKSLAWVLQRERMV